MTARVCVSMLSADALGGMAMGNFELRADGSFCQRWN